MTTTHTPLSYNSLPVELQAYIFELAADNDLGNAGELALVSCSVARWVQTRRFREVALWPNPSLMQKRVLEALERKSKEFLAAHVKRLCMPWNSTTSERAFKLLSNCTGLVDLALWVAFPTRSTLGEEEEGIMLQQYSDVLNALPSLRHLSFSYDNTLRLEQAGTLSRAWCGRLLSLDLKYWSVVSKDTPPVPLLDVMNSLTHLSLAPTFGYDEEVDESYERTLLSMLQVRPSIQVLLVLVDRAQMGSQLQSVPSDSRVLYKVRSPGNSAIGAWRGQHDSTGNWTTAEAEIARRRKSP